MGGLVVAIEGLIGVGKTTLTDSLCEMFGFTAFKEPVEANPFLEDYYKDPHRWSYAMQVNLLWERFKMFQEANYRAMRGEVCVADRSIYGDMAFGLVQKSDGYFVDKEFESYKRMHETLQPMIPYPDLIIWLELLPSDAMERIQKRSRGCESGIQLEYLQHLNEAYQQVLRCLESKCKIVKVDARQSAYKVLCEVMQIIDNERTVEHEINYR